MTSVGYGNQPDRTDVHTRPRRDCQHVRTFHPHGTRNAYVCDKCGCDPCRAANTASERDRNRAKLYGRYNGLVDAEPVREHIRALSAAGIGLKQITRLGGPSGGVLCKIMYGHPNPDGTRRPPSRRVTPNVANRILAVPVDPSVVAASVNIDGLGTSRRLQALMCLGYSQSDLARRLGMEKMTVGRLVTGRSPQAETARAVAALYDELWDTPAVATDHRSRIAVARAISYATSHGYKPPLWWDDDTIDHASTPSTDDAIAELLDEIAVEQAMYGRQVALTKAERAEVIRRMTERGYTAKQIGERLGRSDRTIVRKRSAA